MDSVLALGLVLLAAAYLLWRTLRTFRAPQEGACGSGESCGTGCSTGETSEPKLVKLELPPQP